MGRDLDRSMSSPVYCRFMKYAALIAIALLTMLNIGCSSSTQRKFDISVRNDTAEPITIWLTKDGPPDEVSWRSPEQVAVSAPAHVERIGGMVVPQGKTAYTGEIKGKFADGSFAWLRVYNGKYTFSELLSVSPRSVDRIDFALDEGRVALVVRKKDGRLLIEPDEKAVQIQIPGANP